MTQLIKKHGATMFLAGFGIGLLTFAMMAFTRDLPTTPPAREIVLVAKDVTFRLLGQPAEPNPVLHLKKGEPIRLILRNEEPDKVLHCFRIGGLGVKSSRNLATGESETLTFTPQKRGTFAYACLMHPMMSGKVIVE